MTQQEENDLICEKLLGWKLFTVGPICVLRDNGSAAIRAAALEYIKANGS